VETPLESQLRRSKGLAREWVKALLHYGFSETFAKDFSIVVIKKPLQFPEEVFLCAKSNES
jgi:hypothetical protein